MKHFRTIVFVSIVFTIAAVVMWVLGVAAEAGTWKVIDPRAAGAYLAGAVAASVIAALFVIAHIVRDRDKDALVRAMAEFSQQRAQARTLPLRRVV